MGANSPSLLSPPTAVSGWNSAAAATGSGRASLPSMKVLRKNDEGGVRCEIPGDPTLASGTLGARFRVHEGGSRDPGGIVQAWGH